MCTINLDLKPLWSLLDKHMSEHQWLCLILLFFAFFLWEYWLGKTKRVQANSTLELLWGLIAFCGLLVYKLMSKKET